MMENVRFKPLWMIHNSVYRELNKGVFTGRLKRYTQKILKMLKLKK